MDTEQKIRVFSQSERGRGSFLFFPGLHWLHRRLLGRFNLAQAPRAAGYWLEARSNVPNYTFKPEPIGEAIEILRTTNLVNGIFAGDSKRSWRFLAN
jgi:hypothetical protein